MHKFKVGDRVKFAFAGKADTGTIESVGNPKYSLIYMDNERIGHGRDRRCWWVPSEKLTLLKSKTKRFL